MRIGSVTHVDLLPPSIEEGHPPRIGRASGRNARLANDIAKSLVWAAFQPKARPALDIFSALPSERYDLSNFLPATVREGVPVDHFLNYPVYVSRQFLTGVGRDIAMTLHAKAVAAPGFGLIDEFNVGGAAGLPKNLVAIDLQQCGEEWLAQDGDVERVRGLSIPLCHYGLGTFGHFVLDALLQVFVFRDILSSGAAKLVHWPLPVEWMAPALESCGIPRSGRKEVAKPVILMEQAGVSSALAGHGVYFPMSLSLEFFDWLRVVFKAPRSAGTRRLYIRRSNVYSRMIDNASALEAIAENHGFEVVTPENLPIEEQIRLFAEAGVVISAWGSGLTLAPLLDGPRCVIEILPSAVTDAWFSRQAAVHKLDYRPIVQASRETGDIEMDLVLFENALSALPR